jgi:hypothetical protein
MTDSGRYHVVVSNQGGTAKSIDAVVHVHPPVENTAVAAAVLQSQGSVGGVRSRRRRADERRRSAQSGSFTLAPHPPVPPPMPEVPEERLDEEQHT